MNVRTGNRRLMREVNAKLILGLIRHADRISHIELLRQTRLSAGTVTNIVKELKGRGFVAEAGLGQSVTGRRPVLLQFNPCARYVVGIEVTAAQTRVAVVDLAGRIVPKTTRTMVTAPEPEAALRKACGEAKSILKAMGISPGKLLGAGLAIEGVVDPGQERLVLQANLGWRNVPAKELLEKALRVPAVVNNAGMAMVLGEYLHGVGKGCQSAVCLDVDAGVGAVAILNGRVLRGAHGMAGEIGHNRAVAKGDPCSCGKRGCLETVASAKAIVAKVVAAGADTRGASLPEAVRSLPTPAALRAICKAARRGDPLARQVIRGAGRHLGITAAGLVNLLDPELLILTGMVTYESGDMLLNVVRRAVAEHALQDGGRSVQIEPGTLGSNAAMIGAAAAVYERAFRVPVEAEG